MIRIAKREYGRRLFVYIDSVFSDYIILLYSLVVDIRHFRIIIKTVDNNVYHV